MIVSDIDCWASFCSDHKLLLDTIILFILVASSWPELCYCCPCNSHCNIFNRDRLQMLSGGSHLHHPTTFITVLPFTERVLLVTCSSRKLKQSQKMMFPMGMASFILSLLWEQCTLPCYLWDGMHKTPCKSKFSYPSACFLTSGVALIKLHAIICTSLDQYFMIKEYSSFMLFVLILLMIMHFVLIRWTIDVGWASTWVRIVNEWVATLVYSKSWNLSCG